MFERRSCAQFPRMLHSSSGRKVSPSRLLLQFLLPTLCEVTEGAALWSLGWKMGNFSCLKVFEWASLKASPEVALIFGREEVKVKHDVT